jgi:hypothetical protein
MFRAKGGKARIGGQPVREANLYHAKNPLSFQHSKLEHHRCPIAQCKRRGQTIKPQGNNEPVLPKACVGRTFKERVPLFAKRTCTTPKVDSHYTNRAIDPPAIRRGRPFAKRTSSNAKSPIKTPALPPLSAHSVVILFPGHNVRIRQRRYGTKRMGWTRCPCASYPGNRAGPKNQA